MMDTIGQRIKQARLNKGWTQDELAAAAQITSAAISRYEKGQRNPRIEHLQAIANALGVSTFDLTTFSPEKKEELERANQKLLHLIDTYAQKSECSPEDMEAFKRVKEIIEEDLNRTLTIEFVRTKALSDAEAMMAMEETKKRQAQARSENKAEKRKRQQLDQLISAFSALTEENQKKVLERVAELTALQAIKKK